MLLDGLTDAIYRGRAYHAAVWIVTRCLGKKWVDEEGAREKFLIAQGRDMKFQELFLQRSIYHAMGIVGKEGCLLSLRGGKDISSQQRREERAMFILFII